MGVDDVEFTVTGGSTSISGKHSKKIYHKPLYILSKRRDPRTRNGRVALLVLLPSSVLDEEDGVKAEIEGGTAVNLIFKWPAVMLDYMKPTRSLLTFCNDMNVAHGTLLSASAR